MTSASLIVEALGGHWNGNSAMVRCPAHEDRTPSLSISYSSSGKILFHCFVCDQESVLQALRARGLWDGEAGPAKKYIAPPLGVAKYEYAQKLWYEISETAPGTLAETYLRGRGYHGEIPEMIRFLPNAKHTPSGKKRPCVLAAVQRWPSSEIVGVHRIYLRYDGKKKAKVEPNKMSLGNMRGGAVRLFHHTDQLVLTEGIETGLAVHMISGLPVWAALSTGNFHRVVIPEVVEDIVIAADHDDPGLKAANQLCRRMRALGKHASIVPPPQHGQDWADIIKSGEV